VRILSFDPGEYMKLQVLAQYEGWDKDTANMAMFMGEYELILKEPPDNGIDIGIPTIGQDDQTSGSSH
jgi:hypothetical protein